MHYFKSRGNLHLPEDILHCTNFRTFVIKLDIEIFSSCVTTGFPILCTFFVFWHCYFWQASFLEVWQKTCIKHHMHDFSVKENLRLKPSTLFHRKVVHNIPLFTVAPTCLRNRSKITGRGPYVEQAWVC